MGVHRTDKWVDRKIAEKQAEMTLDGLKPHERDSDAALRALLEEGDAAIAELKRRDAEKR
ncbi:MAG: hypothetical protein PHH26_00265 [Candidatus Thermoplasmatota archaeon]|nr:hypothetical protein [Candidatus Thermoplasmatota archaeon]